MPTIGKIAQIWRYPFKSMAGQPLGRAEIGPRGIPGDRGWAVRDEHAGEIRGAKKIPALLTCRAEYLAEPRADGPTPHVAITTREGARFLSSDSDAAARLSAVLGRSVTLWPLQAASEFYRRGKPDNPDRLAELRSTFGLGADDPLPDLAPFVQLGLTDYVSVPGSFFDAFPLHILTTATLAHLSALNPGARIDVRRFRPSILIDLEPSQSGFVEQDWIGRRLCIGTLEVTIEARCPRCVMTTMPQDDLPKDPSILKTIVKQAGSNVGVYASLAGASSAAVAVGDRVDLV